MRDIRGVQVTDRDVRGRGVQKKLVGRKGDVPLTGVDDSASAVLKGQFKLCEVSTKQHRNKFVDSTYQRNHISRLSGQFVRQLLIVRDQVGNVYIAVVLFH